MTWRSWRDAWTAAVYSPCGFARRESPARHFRTSPHVAPAFAEALVRLVDLVGGREVLDVGAGGGELVTALHALAGDRLRLTGVELADRPAHLPPAVRWCARLSDVDPVDGVLVANEWLDDVPLDVVADGRLVEVAPDGRERAGGPAGAEDRAWVARWRPGGERAEVGRTRDEAWAGAVARLHRGVAVAIDYAVGAGHGPAGTLTGYRSGRAVAPAPDGSMNLTAHVLFASCAAAGERAGATATRQLSQRDALHILGVTGSRPPLALATADPPGYARALQRASEAGELTDRTGLGGLTWLVQAVGVPLPL